jgi:hypothetical protein
MDSFTHQPRMVGLGKVPVSLMVEPIKWHFCTQTLLREMVAINASLCVVFVVYETPWWSHYVLLVSVRHELAYFEVATGNLCLGWNGSFYIL